MLGCLSLTSSVIAKQGKYATLRSAAYFFLAFTPYITESEYQAKLSETAL